MYYKPNYDLFKMWGPSPKSNAIYYVKQDIKAVERTFDQMGYNDGLSTGNIHRCIKKVIFNDPATIVFWKDGTKTVVKCQEGDTFDPEKGIAMAICKKIMGNKSNFNNQFKKIFKKSNSQ